MRVLPFCARKKQSVMFPHLKGHAHVCSQAQRPLYIGSSWPDEGFPLEIAGWHFYFDKTRLILRRVGRARSARTKGQRRGVISFTPLKFLHWSPCGFSFTLKRSRQDQWLTGLVWSSSLEEEVLYCRISFDFNHYLGPQFPADFMFERVDFVSERTIRFENHLTTHWQVPLHSVLRLTTCQFSLTGSLVWNMWHGFSAVLHWEPISLEISNHVQKTFPFAWPKNLHTTNQERIQNDTQENKIHCLNGHPHPSLSRLTKVTENQKCDPLGCSPFSAYLAHINALGRSFEQF